MRRIMRWFIVLHDRVREFAYLAHWQRSQKFVGVIRQYVLSGAALSNYHGFDIDRKLSVSKHR